MYILCTLISLTLRVYKDISIEALSKVNDVLKTDYIDVGS